MDAQKYDVRADGQLLSYEPASTCRWGKLLPILTVRRREHGLDSQGSKARTDRVPLVNTTNYLAT